MRHPWALTFGEEFDRFHGLAQRHVIERRHRDAPGVDQVSQPEARLMCGKWVARSEETDAGACG